MTATRTLTWAVVLATLAVAGRSEAEAKKAPGVPNFHEVNGHVFRGGQPSKEGWASLAKLGVKTVIDLRRTEEHSTEGERKAVEAVGMHYVNIPMNGFEIPTVDQTAAALSHIGETDTVFIHCRQGRDRTGTIVAAYRMSHDRWDCSKAMNEAGACGMHWYEFGMRRFLRAYPTAVVAAAPADKTVPTPATKTAFSPGMQAQITAGSPTTPPAAKSGTQVASTKTGASAVPQLTETKTTPEVKAQITAAPATPSQNTPAAPAASGGGAPAGSPGR
jgi:tyrosine-protein phosphatase SIW14